MNYDECIRLKIPENQCQVPFRLAGIDTNLKKIQEKINSLVQEKNRAEAKAIAAEVEQKQKVQAAEQALAQAQQLVPTDPAQAAEKITQAEDLIQVAKDCADQKRGYEQLFQMIVGQITDLEKKTESILDSVGESGAGAAGPGPAGPGSVPGAGPAPGPPGYKFAPKPAAQAAQAVPAAVPPAVPTAVPTVPAAKVAAKVVAKQLKLRPLVLKKAQSQTEQAETPIQSQKNPPPPQVQKKAPQAPP